MALKSFPELVKEIKARIQETTADAVKAKLDAGSGMVLVDVREDREWAQGHVPGAVHIGKGVIERDIAKQVPSADAEIVLYCGGGARSAIAADMLQQMGYTNVYSLAGGFGGWKESGYEVVEPSA